MAAVDAPAGVAPPAPDGPAYRVAVHDHVAASAVTDEDMRKYRLYKRRAKRLTGLHLQTTTLGSVAATSGEMHAEVVAESMRDLAAMVESHGWGYVAGRCLAAASAMDDAAAAARRLYPKEDELPEDFRSDHLLHYYNARGLIDCLAQVDELSFWQEMTPREAAALVGELATLADAVRAEGEYLAARMEQDRLVVKIAALRRTNGRTPSEICEGEAAARRLSARLDASSRPNAS